MQTTAKIVSLLTAGLLMTACHHHKEPTADLGSTYDMPNADSGRGVYNVIVDGKKRTKYFDSTDLDILSERVCCPDYVKEVAIVRTNRELEIRVGDYSPNIVLEDVNLVSYDDQTNRACIEVDLKVMHSATAETALPTVEVPLFFAASHIPTQEIYKHGTAMARVDLNRPFETQRIRVGFDASDLAARNLKGWSLLTGIVKSKANRDFMNTVEDNVNQHFANAGGYDINTTRTGDLSKITAAPMESVPAAEAAPAAPKGKKHHRRHHAKAKVEAAPASKEATAATTTAPAAATPAPAEKEATPAATNAPATTTPASEATPAAAAEAKPAA